MTPEATKIIESKAAKLREIVTVCAPETAELAMIHYRAGKKAGMTDSLAEKFAIQGVIEVRTTNLNE